MTWKLLCPSRPDFVNKQEGFRPKWAQKLVTGHTAVGPMPAKKPRRPLVRRNFLIQIFKPVFFQAVFRLKQQYDRRLIQAPEDTHAPRWAEGAVVGDVGAVGDGAAAGPLGEVTPGRSRKPGGGEDGH